MAVTKQFAVEVDTELYVLYQEEWEIKFKIAQLNAYFERAKNYKDSHKYEGWQGQLDYYQSEIDKLSYKLNPIRRRQAELNAIYNKEPWTRAFLVLNSNGHVHKDRECVTCFANTKYEWLVTYSNDSEETIVADAGEEACTVCYPSAPARILNQPSKIKSANREARELAKIEREQKKADKLAKAKAKAPTASGEFLYFKQGRYTKVIKTERTAISEWLNNQYWILNSSNPESQESKKQVNEIICQNLAEKNGRTFEEQRGVLLEKYRKSLLRRE